MRSTPVSSLSTRSTASVAAIIAVVCLSVLQQQPALLTHAAAHASLKDERTAVGGVSAIDATVPLECSSYLYAPQCVSDTRCGWCCNATAVQRFFATQNEEDASPAVITVGAAAGAPSYCIDLNMYPWAYAKCGFYSDDFSSSPLMLTRHVFPNLTTAVPTTTQYFTPSTSATALDAITTAMTTGAPPSPTPSTTPSPMSQEPSCSVDVCNRITTEKFGATTCNRCVSGGMCYYCLSLKQCVGGHQHCPNGAIVNTCTPPSEDDGGGNTFLGMSLTTGAILFVVAALVTIGTCGGLIFFLRLRRSWQERRAEEERERRRAAAATEATAATTTTAATTDGATARAATATETAASAATTTTTTTTARNEAPSADALASAALASAAAATAPSQKNKEKKETTTDKKVVEEDSAVDEDDTEEEEDVCALCYERPPSIAFLPCYHAYYCQDCCEKIRPAGGTYACPCCRQPVLAMVNYTHKTPLMGSKPRGKK